MGARAKYSQLETAEAGGDEDSTPTPRAEEADEQEGLPLMALAPAAAGGQATGGGTGDMEVLLGKGGAAKPQTSSTGGRATTAQTYATFFKVFFGIGILAMPRGFVLAGYVGGPIGIACIAWLSWYCIELLLVTRDRIVEIEAAAVADGLSPPKRVNTSGGAVLLVDVAEAAFGKKGRYFAQFCILFSQIGFGISYLIFIGANLEANEAPVAELLGLGEASTAQIELWSSAGCVGIAAVLLLPLVWLRDVGRLACGALVGDAAIIFGLGTVSYYAARTLLAADAGDVAYSSSATLFDTAGAAPGIAGGGSGDETAPGDAADDVATAAEGQAGAAELHPFTAVSLAGFPLFFGSAIFAFEGIALILPIQAAMARPADFPVILRRGILMYMTVLLAFPTVSCFAWREDTRDMITLNLPHDLIVVAMQLLYCVGLFFSYPIQLFPAVQILESMAHSLLHYPPHPPSMATAMMPLPALSPAREEGGIEAGAEGLDGEETPRAAYVAEEEEAAADEEETATAALVAKPSQPGQRRSAHGEGVQGEGEPPARRRRQGRILVFRSLIVGFTALIAALTPEFGLFVNLIGAFTGPFIAFILPTMCHVKLFPTQPRRTRVLAFGIAGVGLLGNIVATTISLIELEKAFRD